MNNFFLTEQILDVHRVELKYPSQWYILCAKYSSINLIILSVA